MIRKFVVPQDRTYVLELPEEFVGKRIEVLAFEVEAPPSEASSEESVEALFDKFQDLTFDSKGTYTYDRDEANNYSEPDDAIVNLSREERIAYLKKVLAPHRVDLSNFTFNRDEANNYD